MEISSRTLVPLLNPGSVYSGSASWDDYGRVFPDELRVSTFRDTFPYYAWTYSAHSDFIGWRLYTCLCVTCHLHFWQNDLGLLRATAVTRGGTDTEWESAHKEALLVSLEKKILPPLLPGFEHATFRSPVRRSYQRATNASLDSKQNTWPCCFQKQQRSALGLCRSNREFDFTWCCLLRLSKWAELSVSWREVSCPRDSRSSSISQISRSHHRSPGSERRRNRKRSTLFLERTRKGPRQSDQFWNCFNGHTGTTSGRRNYNNMSDALLRARTHFKLSIKEGLTAGGRPV